jgi:hypothetical protein
MLFRSVTECVRTTGCDGFGNMSSIRCNLTRSSSVFLNSPRKFWKSCTARRPEIMVRNVSLKPSYAASMLAHSVSPPNSGMISQRRMVYLVGFCRNVVSLCQTSVDSTGLSL